MNIIETYHHRKDVPKYAHLASIEEIRENEYNLNIPRYVDTFEEEEVLDIDEIKRLLAQDKKELVEEKQRFDRKLREKYQKNKK